MKRLGKEEKSFQPRIEDTVGLVDSRIWYSAVLVSVLVSFDRCRSGRPPRPPPVTTLYWGLSVIVSRFACTYVLSCRNGRWSLYCAAAPSSARILYVHVVHEGNWTFHIRTVVDDSYHGLFVPFIFITFYHATPMLERFLAIRLAIGRCLVHWVNQPVAPVIVCGCGNILQGISWKGFIIENESRESAWYSREPQSHFSNPDGLKKFQLIPRLAELSRNVKIQLDLIFSWAPRLWLIALRSCSRK